jgi:CelD/BcsL family acetyltransferase involved in cellulose biosynthesis
MLKFSLLPVVDFEPLGEAWTAVQERAEGSFFQSWAWTGCLAEERFFRPVLLEVRDGPTTVALALFNMRRGSFGRNILWLGESGIAELDALFIEYNGFLVVHGQPASVLAQGLMATQSAPIGEIGWNRGRSLVLSGVSAEYVAAAQCGRGVVRIRSARPAPFVDLNSIRKSGGDFLASLSPNTRYQLRRSERRYASLGRLTLRRAGSRSEALDFLARLARLHHVYWVARGKPGAFDNGFVMRFHTALIGRAFDENTIDLIEIKAGQSVIGYLYNFKHRGRIYAYQSGFDYTLPHRHCKPGLTCHHLAIELCLSEGAHTYDFLAGEDRYKQSLANSTNMLYWAAIHPRWSTAGLVDGAKNWHDALSPDDAPI